MRQPRARGRGHASPARRVVVVSPQTRLALARRGRGARKVVQSHDIDIAAAWAAYAKQRRLALFSMAVLVLFVLGLPLLLALVPQLARVRLGDVPLTWLLLGAAPYPALLAMAWAQVHAAEWAERGDGGGQ